VIAVNIMKIELMRLSAGESTRSALEAFSKCRAELLPVLDCDGIMLGLLCKESLLRAVEKESVLGEGLTVADIYETDFECVEPEASFDELRDKFAKGALLLFVVDKGGRLLGSISEAELTSRLQEYGRRE